VQTAAIVTRTFAVQQIAGYARAYTRKYTAISATNAGIIYTVCTGETSAAIAVAAKAYTYTAVAVATVTGFFAVTVSCTAPIATLAEASMTAITVAKVARTAITTFLAHLTRITALVKPVISPTADFTAFHECTRFAFLAYTAQ
jgi:hypothetical protein